ncbi:hypothetical protein [Campylobacter lanienae]|nr:hypothetical protein [Campylobacter lanienae]MDD7513839.1 hypothetical protein [Campylobacter lanienae]MDY5520027.1 hypothetical protein [Campylobacter lanienae]
MECDPFALDPPKVIHPISGLNLGFYFFDFARAEARLCDMI